MELAIVTGPAPEAGAGHVGQELRNFRTREKYSNVIVFMCQK